MKVRIKPTKNYIKLYIDGVEVVRFIPNLFPIGNKKMLTSYSSV